jgi:1-acyl-sn-glycerol-3-phosphate acyltransferase
MSWFIAVLKSVRVGVLLGRGLFTVRRLSVTTPSAHREAQIQKWACAVLQALGVQVRLQGAIQPGLLLVANHVSWLDVIVLQSLCPQARFVAKADVLRWPVIGRLAQGAGTLFVQRDRPRMAARIVSEVTSVLGSGGTVMVFPEGTTTDGVAVLPFRSSLLQAAFAGNSTAQPIALRYSEGTLSISPSVRYLGDDSLVQSIWWLCRARGVVAKVNALPLRVASNADRKAFAAALRADIEQALTR